MTADEIRNGTAFRTAVHKEYRKFLHTLVQAIEYCDGQGAELTEVGEAGFARINELFTMTIRQEVDLDGTAEEQLLFTWACMILYCIESKRHFAVYAEANALLEDMMAGGWFV